jgi:hypothetical protein
MRVHAINAENDVRDHRHDGGRSGRLSFGYEGTTAGDSGYHAIGADGRGARKEGPCLRQGDGRQSVNQPTAQLVKARTHWRRSSEETRRR